MNTIYTTDLEKSKVVFGENMLTRDKQTHEHNRYFQIPIQIGRSKTTIFA